MKKAFSIIELMLIVAVLGILAALVMPSFSHHIQASKEAAAKDNLRILRNAIQIYAAKHNDSPPGYVENYLNVYGSFDMQMLNYTDAAGNISFKKSAKYPLGPYLNAIPENPFNNLAAVSILGDTEPFPKATGTCGWIYKPATREIRLNWPGTDSSKTAYYDY